MRIEMNVNKKGKPPVWRVLLEDDLSKPASWDSAEEAQRFIADDARELRISLPE